MRKTVYSLALALLLLINSFCDYAQTYQPDWSSLDQRPVPQWYREAKFGIFIHWGVYSVVGWSSKGQYAEWYQQGLESGDTARINYWKKKYGSGVTYYQLADQFKAELYNPDEWAKLIERSGARYVVLTSKHHEGFALWPSKETAKAWTMPWNAAVTGPHRDLLGDLFTAIRKTSVHPGMYYSLYEWYNPIWKRDRKEYVAQYMWPQMLDLVNTYKPEVFWTDGDWDGPDSLWKAQQFVAWLYNESPVKDKIVTYDRWGAGVRFHHGAVYTPEYQPDLDFEDHYFEENRGMGASYGYNREEDIWDYNSAKSLVLALVDKVSRGGNFLLDIGPDEHGKIPPVMEERLIQIGDWMAVNKDAIYGASRWRQPRQGSTYFTYDSVHNDLYAITPEWPGAQIKIRDMPLTAGTKVQLLETKQELRWHQDGGDLVVDLPAFDPARMKSEYAYVIKIGNTGAFAARAAVSVTYPKGTTEPLVTVRSQPNVAYRYTLDEGTPVVYTKPFSVKKTAELSVQGFREGVLPGKATTMKLNVYNWFAASKVSVAGGLHFDTYDYPGAAKSVAEMDHLSAVSTGAAVKPTSGALHRKEASGVIFTGFVKVPEDAIYTLYLSSDDGSKLWIGGQEVIDNDGAHGMEEKSVRLPLKKGLHPFKLAYFNGTGDSGLTLQYSTDKMSKRVIPDGSFFQPAK